MKAWLGSGSWSFCHRWGQDLAALPQTRTFSFCVPNLQIWALHVGWIERCLIASAVFGRWEWEDGGGQDDCSPIFRHLDGHLYWTVLLYPALSP